MEYRCKDFTKQNSNFQRTILKYHMTDLKYFCFLNNKGGRKKVQDTKGALHYVHIQINHIYTNSSQCLRVTLIMNNALPIKNLN